MKKYKNFINENNFLNFSISPNPSNGIFKINAQQVQTVTIYNQQGFVVAKIALEKGFTTVDFSSLPNGVYLLLNLKGGYEKLVIVK